MAKKAGVSCSSIYKWRDRKSSPSVFLLESLCDVLGLHIINLLVKDDELIFLPEQEKELFKRWQALNKDQRFIVLELIKVLQMNNQKK